MLEFLLGSLNTLIVFLIGHHIGSQKQILPTEVKEKIHTIFQRLKPDKEIGAVERPTQQQNYLRDHPIEANEQDIMTQTIDTLNEE